MSDLRILAREITNIKDELWPLRDMIFDSELIRICNMPDNKNAVDYDAIIRRKDEEIKALNEKILKMRNILNCKHEDCADTAKGVDFSSFCPCDKWEMKENGN